MVSMLDVARHAQVSKATVSNTLNKPWLVLPDTQARVKQAIDHLGFVPDQNARRLSGAVSTIIGLVVLDASNPFYTEVTHAIEAVVGEAGYLTILCNSAGSVDKERHYLELLAGQRVAGVILSPAAADAAARGIQGIPEIVLLDHASDDACCVAVDDVAGGAMATSYLVQTGARDLCFVGAAGATRQHVDRWSGARSSLAGTNATLDRVVTDGYDIRAGVVAGERLLAMPRLPEAVVCANDLLAFGVYRALASRGVDVPGRVQLIGYDDIDFSADWIVPLTTVRQPTQELGNTAARMALEHIVAARQERPTTAVAATGRRRRTETETGHQHQTVILQPELVVRQSSRGLS